MSLNIKSQEAEQLARELAQATGESLTRSVTQALRERLERVRGQRGAEAQERLDQLRKIGEDARRRWAKPYRGIDHAQLLYDDRGLPK